MTPVEYYNRSRTLAIYHNHVLDILLELPEQSVNCCVTSPPYWGLRDYGLEPLVWGGRADCEHVWGHESTAEAGRNDGGRDIGGRKGNYQGDGPHKSAVSQGAFCQHQDCQAWCGSLGLEPTPELYVSHLVEIFQAVRRVLRDDGTLWLVLGDSYASQGGDHGGRADNQTGVGAKKVHDAGSADAGYRRPPGGLKPKDLIGIPWRVAFALQADGWYLRSDIIWSKPNPMPESVTDRPTSAHEYVFLLSKSERYFWNQEAVRETLSDNLISTARRNRKDFGAVGAIGLREQPYGQSGKGMNNNNPTGRNIRSVWTIPTQSFPDSHFATYPEELVKRCVLAGCPEGGTVLDPFAGSGTTLKVARDLGCHAWGIEASAEYIKLARKRLSQKMLDLRAPPQNSRRTYEQPRSLDYG